jgi:hypothetical protein
MVSPHNYMSPLATLVNAHLYAAMPNFEIFEIDMDDVPWNGTIDQKLEIVDGELIVPSGLASARTSSIGGREHPLKRRLTTMGRPCLAFGYNPPTGNRKIERVDPATFRADLDRAVRLAAPAFESLWVSDHLMTEDRFRLECWTELTWLAARFPEPLLGTIVMANSYRHPALMAKMAASLQYLSGGRFILVTGPAGQTSAAPMASISGSRIAQMVEVRRHPGTVGGRGGEHAGEHYRLTEALAVPLRNLCRRS